MSFNQIDKPATGDMVAEMNTNHGTIKIRLFPDKTPKTVENFVGHAKNGYYNGVTFHRVINDFMIQGGDPDGTGCGGTSIWGGKFADEFDAELHNIRGALSMANAGPNTNGSQFFIVQCDECPSYLIDQMKQLIDRGFPQTAIDNYSNLGGTPHLDFKHSVFGQIYDGMDVVDEIANVKTDSNDRPLDPVIIESINISVIE